MMWYAHGDLGWAGWTLMITSMLVFWGLLIWGISTIVRSDAGSRRGQPQSPEQRLAHRFAAGEIDADAYRRDLAVLADHGRSASNGSDR